MYLDFIKPALEFLKAIWLAVHEMRVLNKGTKKDWVVSEQRRRSKGWLVLNKGQGAKAG